MNAGNKKPIKYENGWKENIQSFTQTYDNEAMDASLLLMEPYGFIGADDIRYHKTVKAVKKALLHKGLMYRYNSKDDFGFYYLHILACTGTFCHRGKKRSPMLV